MSTMQPKFNFPQIKKVALRSFSLFTGNPDAEFECSDGVTCLIGANGIGKSTLLTAINYCLTGIVSDPSRGFKSMEEYYRHSLNFSEGFFRGRISESESDEADIYISFDICGYNYTICRGFFEPDELRELTVVQISDGDIIVDDSDYTRRERHQKYTEILTEHIGLTSFSEYVFLHHFVFTFDERRLLLFWDRKILERVIYITFGLDPNMAKQVDDINRSYEAEDSKVRNRQWDATKTTKRIQELRSKNQHLSADQKTYDELAAEFERLTNDYKVQVESFELVTKQLRDANLKLATLSANESALREEYAQMFDKGFRQALPLSQHPYFIHGINSCSCRLCGAIGENVAKAIKAKLDISQCPLCDSTINKVIDNEDSFSRLKTIDIEITKIKQNIDGVLKEIARLGREESEAKAMMEKTGAQLNAYEKENEATMLLMKKNLSSDKNDDVLLSSYNDQLQKILEEKHAAEQLRGQLREKLILMQRELQKQYIEVEKDFVPAFTELAHLFLGMDLHVHMEKIDLSGLNLVVEVRGSKRRSVHNLSESQRFFLDIALRMAIIKFISNGSLFLDTPEGSLDIAYEKRAGDMLARFVTNGHHVVMTANLNSSNLLLALARSCKEERMKIYRMTDWAELSDVQREEEGLFLEAYDHIERALRA
jgi:DNA repair exonuclease SbcCD ATPase subunit